MSAAAIAGAKGPPRRGSGGRPTREAAARRDARIVEVATGLFIARGFDGTSVDAVAEAAGVSKPTLYARYRDKRALFEAVLEARIRDWLAPLSAAAEMQALQAAPRHAEAVLDALSRTLVARAQEPGAVALTRCIAAQALQFPDLARLGVSHVYCSPVLEAAPGSAHGYDVVLGERDGQVKLANLRVRRRVLRHGHQFRAASTWREATRTPPELMTSFTRSTMVR